MIRALFVSMVLGAAACAPQPAPAPDEPVAPAPAETAPAVAPVIEEPCVVPRKGEPMMCTQQYEPVCGCDGRTYGNACVATSRGVQRYRPGRCEDPADGSAQESEE